MNPRPEFSLDRPFAVSVPNGLVFQGRRYQVGEQFDWRSLNLSGDEVWDLWVAFCIDNLPPINTALAPAAAADAAPLAASDIAPRAAAPPLANALAKPTQQQNQPPHQRHPRHHNQRR
jgi:hypothetical protein